MANSDVIARLRFLDDAAHLIVVSAPQTSRLLMSKHNALCFDHAPDNSDTQRKKSCGACGTIMAMGWQGKMEMDRAGNGRNKKKGINQRASTTTDRPRAILHTCDTCGMTTRFPINSNTMAPRYKVDSSDQGAAKSSPNVPISSTTASPAPSSSGIKKKSKSSKKGGLAALLAKQKERHSSAAGFGLDLMDFMKNI